MFRKFTSERVRKAHHRRLIILGSIYTLLVVSVFLVLWQFSYASFFRINTVSVSGEKAISQEDIFSVVSPHLSGAYGHIFSKRNTWIFPLRTIEDDLTHTFIRIQKVDLTLADTHTLHVTVEEREPKALVCKEGAGNEKSAQCYFVDTDGLIFAEAPQFVGHTYIAYRAHLIPKPIGAMFLSKQGFANVHEFVQSFDTLSLSPHDVIVDSDSMTIVARAGSHDVRVIVSNSIPYADTIRNLDAILHEKDFSIDSISEIDLRFGNKVFFKERPAGEVDTPSLQSSDASSQLRPL